MRLKKWNADHFFPSENPFGTQVGGPNRIRDEHRCTVRYEVNRTSQFLNRVIWRIIPEHLIKDLYDCFPNYEKSERNKLVSCEHLFPISFDNLPLRINQSEDCPSLNYTTTTTSLIRPFGSMRRECSLFNPKQNPRSSHKAFLIMLIRKGF